MDHRENSRGAGSTLPNGSPEFPAATGKHPGSSAESLDEALRTLEENKGAWVRLGTDDRVSILDRIRSDLLRIEDRWIEMNCEAKGLAAGSFGEVGSWCGYRACEAVGWSREHRYDATLLPVAEAAGG